jgi:hypothetical protein
MKTIDFIDSNAYPKKLSDMISCYFNENRILSGIFAISSVCLTLQSLANAKV